MYEITRTAIGAGAMAGIERTGVAGCLALLVLCVVLVIGGLWIGKECVRRSVNEVNATAK